MGPKKGYLRLVAGVSLRPGAKDPFEYTGAAEHPYRREPNLGSRLQRGVQ